MIKYATIGTRFASLCGMLTSLMLATATSAQTDWSQRIDEALTDESPRAWQRYFSLGQEIAEARDDALDTLMDRWPTIRNARFKQQLVKAMHFDYPMPFRTRLHPRVFEFFAFVLEAGEDDFTDQVMNYLPTYAWRTFESEDEAAQWLAAHRDRPSEAVAISSIVGWIDELAEALTDGEAPGPVLNRISDVGWPWRHNEPLLEAALAHDLADLLMKSIDHESVTEDAVRRIAYLLSDLDPDRFPRDDVDAFVAQHHTPPPRTPEPVRVAARESLHVRTIDSDPRKRWILHPPPGDELPTSGNGLLVVLPGGDGSIDFAPFVAGAIRTAAGEDCVVVQMIAPPIATGSDAVVWPTARLTDDRVDFTMEPVVRAAVKVASIEHRIDPGRIHVMGWSSGGTAAYELAIMPDSPFTGALVAMSVFKPELLSPLDGAAGKSFYILHSPQDFIAMRFPEAAASQLREAGARTVLVEYEGGHGWHGDIGTMIHAAIEWLSP